MFQQLTEGSQVFVLFKAEPKVYKGEVTSVGKPTPVSDVAALAKTSFLFPKFTFDIKVRIDEKEYEFNYLPGDASVYTYLSKETVIADNVDSIIKEVEGAVDVYQKHIDNQPLYVRMRDAYGEILGELNPKLKEAEMQAKRIADLEGKVEQLLRLNESLMDKINEPKSAAGTSKEKKQ